MRHAIVAALALAWLGSPARAQNQDYNGLWYGPATNNFNGLWWGSYDAFQASPDVAPGFWWDHYQPPLRNRWYGPYYTVDHWDPYIPRPVASSFLIYSFANFPPATRPAGYSPQHTPGPITFPQNATVFWQYIWPELSPETRALIGGELGVGGGAQREESLPVLAPVQPKEYYRRSVAGPLRGTYWEERQAPLHELPGPRVIRGDHSGFTQYYRPLGKSDWVFRSTRTPQRVITPGKAKAK